MSQRFRTGGGGRVNRRRPVRFSFDGRSYAGLEGDTLASALLANGVHLAGRSFKYHRPRGILAAGADEPNALVGIRRDDARYTPNVRATQVELYERLEAESQNRSPSLRFDVGAVNGLLSPFLPAGSYYKIFMWPAKAWDRFHEPFIRRAAGLGRAPILPDPDRYLSRFAHCDVLVVGTGPAGLAAALAAADGGARVTLCDEQAELGGSPLAETDAVIDGKPAAAWLSDTVAALARNPRVTLLPRTTAFGYFAANFMGLAERVTDHLAALRPDLPWKRMWQVRAKQVVLAAGAIERPLVFPGNDRPGVMLADAARTYLNRYGVRCGSRAVVVTAHDAAYGAALDLHRAGVTVAAIADTRAAADGAMAQAARAAGIPLHLSSTVVGATGRLRIDEVRLAGVRRDGGLTRAKAVRCDLLLMSGGFTPSVHLFSQSRGKLRFDGEMEAYVPGLSVEQERSAGACRGVHGLAAVLADGAAAGQDACGAAGHARARDVRARDVRARAPAFGVQARPFGGGGMTGALPQGHSEGRKRARPKAFVDFQNDVTAKDLALATREGFHSIEHVKRYTTTALSQFECLLVVGSGCRNPLCPQDRWGQRQDCSARYGTVIK